MARIAKQTRINPVATPARRGRPPGSKNVKPAVSDIPSGRAAARQTAAATPAPKVSKDELRAQVDKLERSNATLRAKSREAVRAAKAAVSRIEELEQNVARLEKKAAAAKPKTAAAPSPASPPRAARGGRRRNERNSGDVSSAGTAAKISAQSDDDAPDTLNRSEPFGEDDE